MFHKVLSMLLSVCLLTGSISSSAYAMSPSTVTTENGIVAETEASTKESGETGSVEEAVTQTEAVETIAETTEEVTGENETSVETTVVPTTEENVPQTTEESVETTVENTEEMTSVEETTEEVTTEAVTEEYATTVADEAVNAQAESEDVVLTLDATTELEVPYYDENSEYKWATFTAKEKGIYNFALENVTNSGYSNSVYMYTGKNNGTRLDNVTVYTTGQMVIAMEADQTVYLRFRANAEGGTTFKVTPTKLETVDFVQGTDGIYTATMGDYVLSTKATVRNKSITLDTTLSSGTEEGLSDSYYSIEYRIKETGATASLSLNSYYSYAAKKDFTSLSMDTEYTIWGILTDNSSNVLGMVSGLSLKTGATEESFILNIGEPDYDSVEIEYENFLGNAYIYYAPADSLTDFQTKNCWNSYETTTFSGLKPGTEYKIWVTDSDGNVLVEKTFTTKAETMNVTYTVTATGPASASVQVIVNGYVGNKEYLYPRVEYTNYLGNVVTNSYSGFYLTNNTDGTKSGTLTFSVTELENDKEQALNIWLQKSNYTDEEVQYGRETKTVTTTEGEFTAADVTFTVSQNETTKTTLDYSITVPEHTNSVYAYVYYRVKGATKWTYQNSKNISAKATEVTGTITNLAEGQEYEVQLGIPAMGLCKEIVTYRMGEVFYTPVVTDDTDAFDSVLTYQLQSTESLEDSTWTVSAKLSMGSTAIGMIASKQVLNADNGYQIQLKTSSVRPNAEFTVVWELYKDGSNYPCHTEYQTITTKEADMTVSENSVGISQLDYTITLNSGTENWSDDKPFNVCLTEKATGIQASSDYVYLNSLSNSGTVSFTGLKPGTAYDLTIYYSYYGTVECGRYSSTTKEDDRAISEPTIAEYLTSADIKTKLTGTVDYNSRTYVLLYYREKGMVEWKSDYNYSYYTGDISFSPSELKESTTYEYTIGIGKSYNTGRAYLTSKYTGEFTTLTDDRSVSVNSLDTYCSSAYVEITVSGSVANKQSGYLYFLYREKGTEDDWTLKGPIEFYQEGKKTFSLTEGLKESTEYEYVLGLLNTYYYNTASVDMDELRARVDGTFKTMADDRELTISKETPTLTGLNVTVSLTGEAARGTNHILFYYRKAGTEDTWVRGYASIEGTGERSMTFFGLEEATSYEYVLGLGDSYSTEMEKLKKAKTGTVTTLTDNRSVSVNSLDVYVNSVVLKGNITGSMANARYNYARMYYREQGEETYSAFVQDNVYGEGEVEFEISGLKEATTYEYVLGICPDNNYSVETLKNPITSTFTTMTDDRTLVVSKVTPYMKTAKAEVEIAGTAAGGTNYVLLYYRKTGTEDTWSYSSDTAEGAGKATLTFWGLEEDTAYEYVLGLGDTSYTAKENLRKTVEGTFETIKDDRELTVESVNAYLNKVEINVAVSGDAAAENYNYVLLYYRKAGTEDDWQRKYNSVEGANKTTFTLNGLQEDTAYEYVLGLGDNWNTAKENLKKTIEDTFTTIKDDRVLTVESVDAYLNKVEINVAVSGDAATKNSNYVLLYYRKAGTEDEWKREDNSVEGAKKTTLTLWGLEEDTAYEYVLGLGDTWYTEKENLKKTIEDKFITLRDDRTVSVAVEPSLHNAKLALTLSGQAAKNTDTYVYYGWKEKGAATEENTSYNYFYNPNTYSSTIWNYNDEQLKENTTYEYWVAIAKEHDAPKEEMFSLVEGEFTTLKDPRILKGVGAQAGYQSVTFEATVADNTFGIGTYVYYLYKEAGTEQWSIANSWAGYNNTKKVSTTISGLKQGTKYDYAVVISDNYDITSPDQVTKENQKVTGTITTKQSDYEVTVKANEAKTTYNKAVLEVSATGTNKDAKLFVDLVLSNGSTVETTLSQMLKYKTTITLTGLVPETEYSVTKANIYVLENDIKLQIGSLPLAGVTFKTKKAVAPTTLTLSEKELFLNTAYSGNQISYRKLKVNSTPADAAKEVIWTSSNENVATVAGDGTVWAQAPGEAVITATSVYDPNVSVTCNVTVVNYVIVRNVNGEKETVQEDITLSEGVSLDGFGLYQVEEDGSLAALDQVQATPERVNVVSVSQDTNGITLKGTSIGSTKVYFEKEGFRSVISVKVTATPYNFGVTGLTASDSNYKAISVAENTYEIAYKEGLTYTVYGEIAPYIYFNAYEFEWTSSDAEVASVEAGVITPKKAGEALITVTPINKGVYATDKVTFKVQVKELPFEGESHENVPTVYALTNVDTTLEDVEFPKEWGEGWSWRDPQTPLYSLPVNYEAYEFEAYYSGEDKYSYEGSVNVYISTITGIYVGESYDDHNGVIQVGAADADTTDTIYLYPGIRSMGTLPPNLEKVMETDVDGLTIELTEDGKYAITAQRAGVYNLNTMVNQVEIDENGEKSTKNIMTGTYRLTAVDDSQVDSISFTTDAEDVFIDEESGMIRLDFSKELIGKTFTLNATVKGRADNELDTAIDWKITDKTVATVKYDKKDSHKATITVKGDGHAVLMVNAKDATAYKTELDLEFRDYKPRVSNSKAAVNLAFDYKDSNGRGLAQSNNGMVEISEAYGNYITDVKLLKTDGTPETNLNISYSYNSTGVDKYLVEPANYTIRTGSYKCILSIKTQMSEDAYEYPLTVTVTNKKPSVTAKTSTKVNLFYMTKDGYIEFNITQGYYIDSLVWTDASSTAIGFDVNTSPSQSYSKGKYYYRSYVDHQKVEVVDGQLADPNIAKGDLSIKVRGIRENIEIKNFKIGYNYKKPQLKLYNSSSNVIPKAGNVKSNFWIYDPQAGHSVYYTTSASATSYYYYHSMTDDNENVDSDAEGSYIYNTYNSDKKKEVVTYTLDSANWREPLQVKHTINVIEPKAKLAASSITYNKAYKSSVSTYVYMQNYQYVPQFMDLEVTGSDAKASALVDADIFDIEQGKDSSATIKVTLNQAKLMDLSDTLKMGTYSFKLTPYYQNVNTGEKVKLNTLTLKLKVVDKPITVKVSPKGSLDIAKGYETLSLYSVNSIYLNAKFSNLGDGYQITDARIKGEYSKYFTLIRSYGSNYYLKISDEGISKLKAGQNYNLTIEYDVKAPNGDTFVVTSNVIKVKPKQSAPKVTVNNNNQVLYASNVNMYRNYNITVPAYYSIEDASGYLDVNKDGRIDLRAYVSYSYGTSADVIVEILDYDAVMASAKGKAYSIPVTVKVTGRDGISKDAMTTFKVTVKR